MTRTHAAALLALLPALALAQNRDGAEPGDPVGTASDAPAAAASPAAASPAAASPAAAPGPSAAAPSAETPPPEQGPADAAPVGMAPLDERTAADEGTGAPPETYTVRQGDTLWDLSGRFLNNPWYWPKIWSYNPEITNPHWIYPGNVVRFYPSGGEGPARVEPVAEGANEEPEAVSELEDLSRADMKGPAGPDEADAVAVAGPYKIGYAPRRTVFVRRDAFVTPRELDESGSIRAAFEEKLMLSSLDRAYAHFRRKTEVKVGETYVIYKTDRPIYHPKTNELFGYQSTVLGAAKVVAVDDRTATLVISQTLEPIERGAMLGPWTQKLLRPVTRTPNRRAVEGRIIAAQVEIVTQVGENHVVFVDRGQKDGVEEGNVFTVVRSGDQYGNDPRVPTWDPGLPIERVGELVVVDVRERASTALVSRSLTELMIGDRVEMRPEGASGAN